MGCACCSNIDVYDISKDGKELLHVAEIRGTRSIHDVCALSGAISLYHLSRDDKKGVKVLVGPLVPPMRVIRHISVRKRNKFECPFCYGIFNTSMVMKAHLQFCVLHLSGTVIERR